MFHGHTKVPCLECGSVISCLRLVPDLIRRIADLPSALAFLLLWRPNMLNGHTRVVSVHSSLDCGRWFRREVNRSSFTWRTSNLQSFVPQSRILSTLVDLRRGCPPIVSTGRTIIGRHIYHSRHSRYCILCTVTPHFTIVTTTSPNRFCSLKLVGTRAI